MIENLVSNNLSHVKALPAADRVHNHVAMNANEVLAVKYGVFVLAGGIDNFRCELLAFVLDDL